MREGTYVYLWLVHTDVWQKPAQNCKAVILQLKINKFLKMLHSSWQLEMVIYNLHTVPLICLVQKCLAVHSLAGLRNQMRAWGGCCEVAKRLGSGSATHYLFVSPNSSDSISIHLKIGRAHVLSIKQSGQFSSASGSSITSACLLSSLYNESFG